MQMTINNSSLIQVFNKEKHTSYQIATDELRISKKLAIKLHSKTFMQNGKVLRQGRILQQWNENKAFYPKRR